MATKSGMKSGGGKRSPKMTQFTCGRGGDARRRHRNLTEVSWDHDRKSRNLTAKFDPRLGRGGRAGRRKKGDDEKNPISRFDPKAKAATRERIEGAAALEKKRCLARTVNIECYVNLFSRHRVNKNYNRKLNTLNFT